MHSAILTSYLLEISTLLSSPNPPPGLRAWLNWGGAGACAFGPDSSERAWVVRWRGRGLYFNTVPVENVAAVLFKLPPPGPWSFRRKAISSYRPIFVIAGSAFITA